MRLSGFCCAILLGFAADLAMSAPAHAFRGSATKTHRETVRSSEHRYTVRVGGTADEFNTLDYAGPHRSRFQPNLSIIIANTGDVPVASPRIVINGRRDWYSIDGIIAAIIKPGMNDEERAYALWDWCRRNISGGVTTGKTLWGEDRSVVSFMNCFGTGACGTFHRVMPLIGSAAGMECDSGCLGHCAHAVQRERYYGTDHYFDCMIGHGSGQPAGHFPLALDNQTVAGSDDICNDRYLLARVGSGAGFDSVLSYFGTGRSFHPMKHDWRDRHTMSILLRPGESVERTWRPVEHSWLDGKPLPEGAPNGTGKVRFQPRLTQRAVQRDAVSTENVAFGKDGFRAADPGRAAEVVYRIYSPYVLTGVRVGGSFTAPTQGAVELLLSFDGERWESIWRSDASGRQTAEVSLASRDQFRHPAVAHQYFVKARFAAGAPAPVAISRLWMEAEFQTYLLSLPSLNAGDNAVEYRDDTADPHEVTIVHRWTEAAAPVPPAPAQAVQPADGGDSGFDTAFEWQMPRDSKVAVDAYEFFLSPREDLAWPLLACYHSVRYAPEPRFTPPSADAFIDGRTYYWRVRARSGDGVWGSWSKTWSFVAHGPGPARKPHVSFDQATGRASLTWKPPAGGRPVVRYEVYAGDAPGFTTLREPRESFARVGDKESITLPANLIGDTTGTEFDITGRAEPFYRIIAVDDAGSRSQPTTCAAVPHPALAAAPSLTAVAGQPFEATVPVIRSVGLPMTDCKGPPRYGEDVYSLRLEGAPDWLAFDGDSGLLKGRPPVGGEGESRFVVHLTDGAGKSDSREYVVTIRRPRG